jgi:hypothetical protein
MAKETLKQALYLFSCGKRIIRCGLAGCPEGGWAQTEQARAQLLDELPLRSERAYTVDEFISAAYELDHAGRYQVRAEYL